MSDGAPTATRTAAVLVLYRPAAPPLALIRQLRQSVAVVVVVDNDEAPDPALHRAVEALGGQLIANANRGAIAGAYNRAVEWLDRQQHDRVDQVLLLDQDSDVSRLAAFLSDAEVAQCLADPATAAVAPAYRDRATGLRGRFIELQRWRLHHLEREFSGPRRVAFVINSMSVWRCEALRRIGPFNESLALDHVDTEYCLRARRLGLAVWVHGGHEFAHSIGARRRYRFLGRELQAGGHSAPRRFQIGRSTAWLARRYLLREPAFALLCLLRLAYEAVGIVKVEDQAGAKLRSLARGAASGLFGRLGP
ncbi:MAG: hypothetical protein U1F56_06035 [Rubrivivax sp.]